MKKNKTFYKNQLYKIKMQGFFLTPETPKYSTTYEYRCIEREWKKGSIGVYDLAYENQKKGSIG